MTTTDSPTRTTVDRVEDLHRKAQQEKVERAERVERVAEIRKGLEVIRGEVRGVIEIRALNVPAGRGYTCTASGCFDDLDKAAEAAYTYDLTKPSGIYVTLNPVNPALIARAPNRIVDKPKNTTADHEIVSRIWLFVDVDPHRPAGIGATDSEQAIASELAHDAEAIMRKQGFPLPVIESSGNGYYLLYRIELPNDAEVTGLLKRFYAGLNALLGGIDPSKPYAEIDTGVYNAARIMRVPGTTNRKGFPTDDRPHRRAELFDPPEPIEVVDRAKIEAVAAHAPKSEANGRSAKSHTRSSHKPTSFRRIDVERYLADRNVPCTVKTNTDRTLYVLKECPFDPQHGARGESSIVQNGRGLTTYHCMHNSCQGKRWQDIIQALGPLGGHHFDPPRESRSAAPKGGGQQGEQPVDSETSEEPPRFTELLNSGDFAVANFHRRFLTQGILVEGQPGVIGGRSKAMKTTVALDLVISLGSGTPFLGRFETEKVNVAFWSGESGGAVLQETAVRVARAHDVALADCSVHWGFELPKLSVATHLDALADVIQQHALHVVVVDPLYLSLLTADDAGRGSDLYFMGSRLQALSALGQTLGVTILVLHHFRKNQADDAEPASLEELSQSGVAEWTRQWILLARRAPYEHDGHHDLWMRCGGSAGHGALWGLSIDEGLLDSKTFTGRTWDVTVEGVQDAREAAKRTKADRKAKELEAAQEEHKKKLLEALRHYPDGETAKTFRDVAGLNAKNFGKAIQFLLSEGRAAPCEIKKSRGTYDGFKPTGK